MRNFIDVRKVFVPKTVIDRGYTFLRSAGRSGCEGLVVWIGQKQGQTFYVTDLIIPQQKGIRTGDGVCVVVEGTALARLNADLFKRKLQMIGQVHSHPQAAYHSPTDDEYAIATKVGCLSLVVPDFAVRPFSLNECATYRLDSKGRWMGLSKNETSSLIHITTDTGRYYGAC